ncbi:S8 family peptidase [Lysobacter soli]|uniref:S8 family peptidase n=1 Tax=Lysobacter soli TaxID=453783 RepID=UPI0024107539|nr:S8 family peptidase [Lysobacter soli]MDG2516395.1 S8 family peptidase [Lysobacter soli]
MASALGKPLPEDDIRVPVDGLKLGQVVEVTTIAPLAGSRSQATKVPTTLEFPSQDVLVLRTERHDDRTESALLFVPDDAQSFLQNRIAEYGSDIQEGERRPDLNRFEVIEAIRPTRPATLFLGRVDFNSKAASWWELWIPRASANADSLSGLILASGLDLHGDRLVFPEMTVLFVHGPPIAVARFAALVPGAISEIRRATGTIEPFLDRGEGRVGQHDWVSDLASRTQSPPADAPAVCILDTGVAAEHPLLAPGLRGAWAYDAAWGTDDHHPDGGHGTALVGLALYGDLAPHMSSTEQVQLAHAAESMKLLPPSGFPPTQPPSYGILTQGAIGLVEIERPDVVRSYCLANSATDFPSSRPSTWSGALDQAAAGSMPGDGAGDLPAPQRPKRLVLVATGNVSGGMLADVTVLQALEDPSQSWNALTIGGITQKDHVPPPTVFSPVVPANSRSPFSRGSTSLPPDLTPIKPEVLFEAGNMVSDKSGWCAWNPAVSLLATGSDTVSEPLVPFWATSAAVGVAGHFVGQLQAALPGRWPETYRALTVDSARWPEPIRKKLMGKGISWASKTKAQMQTILREVGYGMPDIQRAVSSARNDVTLIAEAYIQPFAFGADGRTPVFNEMHIYDLPWPRGVLEQLENEIVTMKVTLSYFIEPNLTGKAATRPETYRSFGLRFDMKKRTETTTQFRERVSATQSTDAPAPAEEKSCWLLGPKSFQAGSLHCDLWRGRAVDLSGHDAIAIYPVGGWWKSQPGQRRVTDQGRYALVISISAPGHSVDLYTEINNLVEVQEIEALVR